jgi:hypothetical protein
MGQALNTSWSSAHTTNPAASKVGTDPSPFYAQILPELSLRRLWLLPASR